MKNVNKLGKVLLHWPLNIVDYFITLIVRLH